MLICVQRLQARTSALVFVNTGVVIRVVLFLPCFLRMGATRTEEEGTRGRKGGKGGREEGGREQETKEGNRSRREGGRAGGRAGYQRKEIVFALQGFRRRANRHENANLGRVDVFAPATSAQAPVSSAGRPSALRPVVSAAPAALHFVRRRSHSLQLRLRGSPPHRCCHSLRLWLRLWLRRLPTTTTKTTTTKNNHQKPPRPKQPKQMGQSRIELETFRSSV